MATLTIDQSAPHFSLSGTDGKTYTLNQDSAKLTLAVFFKTTCPTCALAFPYVENIHRAYGEAGLAVWAISQNPGDQTANFASIYPSTFPVLIDADWRVSREYDPEFVPTMFLIDANNRIIDRIVAFDKAGLGRMASAAAAILGVPAVVVAPANDGNPPFKPG